MTESEYRELSDLWNEYRPSRGDMCEKYISSGYDLGCECPGCQDHPRFLELMEKMFEVTYHGTT